MAWQALASHTQSVDDSSEDSGNEMPPAPLDDAVRACPHRVVQLSASVYATVSPSLLCQEAMRVCDEGVAGQETPRLTWKAACVLQMEQVPAAVEQGEEVPKGESAVAAEGVAEGAVGGDRSDASEEAGAQEDSEEQWGWVSEESESSLGLEEQVAWVDQRQVVVSLHVRGETVRTSLATVVEGARQGGQEFQRICGALLGPGWEGQEWLQAAVPADVAASAAVQVEFVDNNPRVFEFVLDYLQGGQLPSGDTHMLENVRAWATRTGMQALP